MKTIDKIIKENYNKNYIDTNRLKQMLKLKINQDKIRMLKRICKELFDDHNGYDVCKLYMDCMDCPVGKELNKIRSEK